MTGLSTRLTEALKKTRSAKQGIPGEINGYLWDHMRYKVGKHVLPILELFNNLKENTIQNNNIDNLVSNMFR